MTYKIIFEPQQAPHVCDKPRIPLLKPSRMNGMVVECECGVRWKCQYLFDSQGGSYDWTRMYDAGSLAVDLR